MLYMCAVLLCSNVPIGWVSMGREECRRWQQTLPPSSTCAQYTHSIASEADPSLLMHVIDKWVISEFNPGIYTSVSACMRKLVPNSDAILYVSVIHSAGAKSIFMLLCSPTHMPIPLMFEVKQQHIPNITHLLCLTSGSRVLEGYSVHVC